jgi:hypothetical protein
VVSGSGGYLYTAVKSNRKKNIRLRKHPSSLHLRIKQYRESPMITPFVGSQGASFVVIFFDLVTIAVFSSQASNIIA